MSGYAFYSLRWLKDIMSKTICLLAYLQLGNNRGNKYSKKSTLSAPTSPSFWNFSIDQFAFHDIPNSIDYILTTTSSPSLAYIGFSQGTAQAFATLSIHPPLNSKISLFIALAPAMSPAGLSNGLVNAFIKSSPNVIFLAFGRRSILSSATTWQNLLYPPIFIRIIDFSLSALFGWKARNISTHQKLAAYPHLYSYTSTKSVVHWFQIIRNNCFQMYDDDVQTPLSISASDRYYKVAKFPTRNIKTPIVLVYGGSDSLIDINVMLKELPRHTIAKEIPHYEHLDFLWAHDVDKLVFPHVFAALEKYAGKPQGHLLDRAERYGSLGKETLGSYSSEDDNSISSMNNPHAPLYGTPNSISYGNQIMAKHSPSASHSAVHAFSAQPSNLSFQVEQTPTPPHSSPSPPSEQQPSPAGQSTLKRRRNRADSLSSSSNAGSDHSSTVRKVSPSGIRVGASKATLGGILGGTETQTDRSM